MSGAPLAGVGGPPSPIAARVRRVKPSPTTVAAALARQLKAEGRDVVDMTIGEPDFDTPEFIRRAAHEAIERGETRYTAVNGTPALRKAILAKLARDGLDYAEDEITLGGGGKQVIFTALLATVEAGVEVIVPAPYWVSYPDMVLACDGTPIEVPCTQDDGFKLGPTALERAITPRTRWLLLNAPSNPTGATYTVAELEALAAVLRRHPHVWVLLDDIYNEIVFDGLESTSLAKVAPDLKNRILLVNGVSKSYAMTGWRIGYGAGPRELIEAINVLISQSTSCPSSISQAAAAAALTGDQSFVAHARGIYAERRDVAVAMLNAIPGLSCLKPEGAFYVFPNCAGVIGKRAPNGRVIGSDQDFTLYLIEQGVIAVHGSAYGLSAYFRLAIAADIERVREGCRRIARAVARLD